jgi:hypothetical protein
MDAGAPTAQPAGYQSGGGFGPPQVSDADCAKIDDVLKKHPKEKKQLDDLRAKMMALRPAGANRGMNGGGQSGGAQSGAAQPGGFQRRQGGAGRDTSGGAARRGGRDSTGGANRGGGRAMSPEMQAINDQMKTIYTTLGVDQRTAGQCARRQMGTTGQVGGRMAAGAAGSAQQRGPGGALTPSPEMGARPARQRPGLVFVTDSTKTVFHPRIVRLGQGNLDYTEVIDGLKEGERVVMLGSLALQAQRQQQQDRIRQNASPLGGATPPAGGGGGGGPRGGGGGRGG